MYTLRNSFLMWKVDCITCIYCTFHFKPKQLAFLPYKEIESHSVVYLNPVILYYSRETEKQRHDWVRGKRNTKCMQNSHERSTDTRFLYFLFLVL